MCGIAGVAALGDAPAPTTDQLRAMCDTIVHRGPDDEGIEVAGGVGLGMRRLSIIDLAHGHQPIHNEDGTVRTVFNGEIYNFRELRRELEAHGHTFRTRADTEVLVHGYEQWGSDLPQRLNGMFAFAIHDARRQRLFFARDHVGIKPFYYFWNDAYFVWGSEIKAVLASGLVPRAINLDALAEFLTWEYVPGAGTLLRAVHKLEPAHYIDIDLAAPRIAPRRYWDVACAPNHSDWSPREWQDAIDTTLGESVQRQLVSDVPLGAFLSGGVDSSLVVAKMGGARTFSIGFEDQTYNELPWAERVAEHLGVSHRSEIIRPDVVELFHQLMYFMDDPIGDFSIFPTYLVSKLAREEVTVALSGDGGDELFGGYETYVAQLRARQYEQVPAWIRSGVIEQVVHRLRPTEAKKGLVNKAKRFVEGLGYGNGLGHARWRVFLSEGTRAGIFTDEVLGALSRDPFEHIHRAYSAGERYGPINACLYTDFRTYLPDNILVKVDRMSMAISLEARVPYLDPGVVDLAFQVPESLKVTTRETKGVLKEVAARHVPRECVYRAKEGFSIPIKNWLGNRFRPLMEDLLAPQRLRDQGWFDPTTMARLKAEHLAGAANHSHILWAAMVFQAWTDMWLEKAVA